MLFIPAPGLNPWMPEMGGEPLTTIPPPTLCPMDSTSSLLDEMQEGMLLLGTALLEPVLSLPSALLCSPGCWRLSALPRQREVLESCPGNSFGKGNTPSPRAVLLETPESHDESHEHSKAHRSDMGISSIAFGLFSFSKQKVVEA